MSLEAIVDSVFQNKQGEVCITFRGINAGVKLPDQKMWFYSAPMPWVESLHLRHDIYKDLDLHVKLDDVQMYKWIHPLSSNRFRVKAKAKDSHVFRDKYFRRQKVKDQQGNIQLRKDGKPKTKKAYKFRSNFSIQAHDIANVGEIVEIDDNLETRLRQAQDSPEFSFVDFTGDFNTRGFVNWQQILEQGICFFDTEQPHYKYPDKKITSHAAFTFYRVVDGQKIIDREYHTLRKIPRKTKKGFKTYIHETPEEMGQAITQSILEHDPWTFSASNINHDIREMTNDFGFEVGGAGREKTYKITSPQDFPKGIKMHRRVLMDLYKTAKYAINFLGDQKLKTFTAYALDESERKKDLSYETMELYEDLIIDHPFWNRRKANIVKDYQIQDVVVLRLLSEIGFGQDLAYLGNWSRLGFDAIQDRTWMKHYWYKKLLETTGIDINADFPKIQRAKETVPKNKLALWQAARDKDNGKNATQKIITQAIKETFGENSPGEYHQPHAYYVPYTDSLATILSNTNPEFLDLMRYKNTIHCQDPRHETLRKKHLETIIDELVSPVITDYSIYEKYKKQLIEMINQKGIDKEKTRKILQYVYHNTNYFQRYHLDHDKDVKMKMELRAGFDDYKRLIPEFSEMSEQEKQEKKYFYKMYQLYRNLSDVYFVAKKSYGVRLEQVGQQLNALFDGYRTTQPTLASYQNIIFAQQPIQDQRLIYLGQPDKIKVSASKIKIDWQQTTKGSEKQPKEDDPKQYQLL